MLETRKDITFTGTSYIKRLWQKESGTKFM